MKYVSYNVDNHSIEVYNSITGIETIKVNNEVVSEKFSFFGTDHSLQINNQFYTLKSGIEFFGFSFKVFSNGKPLKLVNLISKKEKNSILLKKIVLVFFGVIIGLTLGNVNVLDTVFALI